MTNKTGFIERRKQKRFKGKEKAFATLNSDCDKKGQINDISKDGLSFLYFGDGEESNGSAEIEIYSTNDDFYLRKLPVRIVSDVSQNSNDSFSSISTRKLALRFGKLIPKQKLMLNYFLKKYTNK
jgi:hypothetical protein